MEIDWIHRTGDERGHPQPVLQRARPPRGPRPRRRGRAARRPGDSAGASSSPSPGLLEEVAAFGGVLRAFGVGPGERVLSRLPMGADGLVAALATARLGGVHVVSAAVRRPGRSRSRRTVLRWCWRRGPTRCSPMRWRPTGSRPDAVVWRGDLPEGHDLEWDVLMRAGRTDPAPTAEVPVTAEAFVIGDRTITVRGSAGGRHRPRPWTGRSTPSARWCPAASSCCPCPDPCGQPSITSTGVGSTPTRTRSPGERPTAAELGTWAIRCSASGRSR